MVCSATGLAATTTCPYQVPGVIEIAPSDDGSPGATKYCPHTPDYFTNPANAAFPVSPEVAAQQAIAQQQAAAAQAAQQAAQQAQQQIDAQADAEEAGGGEAPADDE